MCGLLVNYYITFKGRNPFLATQVKMFPVLLNQSRKILSMTTIKASKMWICTFSFFLINVTLQSCATFVRTFSFVRIRPKFSKLKTVYFKLVVVQ